MVTLEFGSHTTLLSKYLHRYLGTCGQELVRKLFYVSFIVLFENLDTPWLVVHQLPLRLNTA